LNNTNRSEKEVDAYIEINLDIIESAELNPKLKKSNSILNRVILNKKQNFIMMQLYQ
jgi:hypothetical protein